VECGLPIAPSSKKKTTKKGKRVAIIEENIIESMELNSLEHSIFGDGPPNIVPEDYPQGNDASFSCGSMLLGSLTKEMDVASLLFPRPEVPFPDLSFSRVCDKVRCMKSGPRNFFHYSSYRGQHGCTLTETLTAIIGPIDIDTIGLRLREHARL
jgi:hypothetical protein